MGQAFDERGRMVAEAFGNTKREVLDKLEAQAPNAASVKIMTLERQIKDACDPSESDPQGGLLLPSNERDGAPCRELAKTMLASRVRDLETKLAGAKHLLKIVENLEDGSPAEVLIWTLLCSSRSKW